jgi:hypothetical protein
MNDLPVGEKKRVADIKKDSLGLAEHDNDCIAEQHFGFFMRAPSKPRRGDSQVPACAPYPRRGTLLGG